jgi:hypothetical protein
MLAKKYFSGDATEGRRPTLKDGFFDVEEESVKRDVFTVDSLGIDT